jgi:hypothetical protein
VTAIDVEPLRAVCGAVIATGVRRTTVRTRCERPAAALAYGQLEPLAAQDAGDALWPAKP